MDKIICATCPHCIYEYPFYWCGLERTDNSDADVTTLDWKPLEVQPEWCRLREE